MGKIKRFIGSSWGKFVLEVLKMSVITVAFMYVFNFFLFDVPNALMSKFNMADIQMYRSFMNAMDTESGRKITQVVACVTLFGIGLPVLYSIYMGLNIFRLIKRITSDGKQNSLESAQAAPGSGV